MSLKKLNLFSYVLKNRNFRHTTYCSNSDDIIELKRADLPLEMNRFLRRTALGGCTCIL